MYVIVTCVPDFPSSLHLRCRLCYEANHRYQSLLFELPLMKNKKSYKKVTPLVAQLHTFKLTLIRVRVAYIV